MTFEVNFRAVGIADGSKRIEKEFDIVEPFELMPLRNVGTDLLKKFGLKAEEIISDSIDRMSNNIDVEISQELAENSGRFTNENRIWVQVSEPLLKKFVHIDVHEDEKGKRFRYASDKKALLEFWTENNYELLILTDEDKERLKTREKKREEAEAYKVRREAEKAAREKERTDWIRKYGSDYLKDCLELGVKANLEYVVERAAMEFPGYVVDYAEEADWEEKFSPSREALSELKELRANGVDAEIVWLTEEPKVRKEDDDDDDYYYDKFEPCEAILIRNYLDYYKLFKIIE